MADARETTPADKLELELRRGVLVLAVLTRLRQPRYGYSLRQALAERGMPIEEGTLYPLLRRLEAQGLLDAACTHAGNRRPARLPGAAGLVVVRADVPGAAERPGRARVDRAGDAVHRDRPGRLGPASLAGTSAHARWSGVGLPLPP